MQAAVSDGWAEIQPGQEHSFAFLFIEVDDAEELKKRHEPENLAAAMATFREFIERIVAAARRTAVDVVPFRRARAFPAARAHPLRPDLRPADPALEHFL